MAFTRSLCASLTRSAMSSITAICCAVFIILKAPTIVAQLTCFAKECSDIGGMQINSSCFRLAPVQPYQDFHSASTQCAKNAQYKSDFSDAQQRLAQVRSLAVWNAVQSLVTTDAWTDLRCYSTTATAVRNDHYYTAYTYAATAREISVTDDGWDISQATGSPIDYTSPYHCMVMSGTSPHTWSGRNCSDNGISYLCEYSYMDISSMQNLCVNNFKGHYWNNTCYKFYLGPPGGLNVTNADSFCYTIAGTISNWHSGRLAYLSDLSIYTEVRNYLATISVGRDEPWIGLIGTGTLRTDWGWGVWGWTWPNDVTYFANTVNPSIGWAVDNISQTFNYASWASSSKCARLSSTLSDWIVSPCSDMHSFVCQFTETRGPCEYMNLYSGSAPRNCEDIKRADPAATTNWYVIQLTDCTHGSAVMPTCCLTVWCDMTSFGGGWLQIQRRVNASGSNQFAWPWAYYRSGFNNVYDPSYWIGLDNLYMLTQHNTPQYELLIELKPYELSCYMYARYSLFKVSDACHKFQLNIGTYLGGTLGDALSRHNGTSFSTYDNDNDNSSSNCANETQSGWWFHDCLDSNLNGQYCTACSGGEGCTKGVYGKNIIWSNPKGWFYSFEQSHMKIRPINSPLDNPTLGNHCPSLDNLTAFICPEDCGWSLWSSWTACAGSCDNGTIERNRTYQSPAQFGGMVCQPGVTPPPIPYELEVSNCSLNPCPINCSYDVWASWTSCSVTCGNGTQERQRNISVYEQYGGEPCDPALLVDCMNCTLYPCAINCSFDVWSIWSACSVTCGNGTITRNRPILQPAMYGGVGCNPINASEWAPCTQSPCPPVNCSYGSWSTWSSCDCNTGEYTRQKTIAVVAEYGGEPCDPAEAYEAQMCDIDNCGDPDVRLPTAVKAARQSLQTLGCAWLIGLVGFTIVIFILFKQFSLERVLHMCQEISLLVAHIIILFSVNNQFHRHRDLCIVTGVFLQYLFYAHFAFLLLETIQTYAVLTNVINLRGFMTMPVNLGIGWGVPAVVVLLIVGGNYNEYPAPRSCWLNMDNDFAMASLIPIASMCAISIIAVEAAGLGSFQKLPLQPDPKRTSAQLSRTSMLFILPLSAAAWFLGHYSLFTGNVGYYSLVFILNIALGAAIFQFHTLQNEEVRTYIAKLFCCCKRSDPSSSRTLDNSATAAQANPKVIHSPTAKNSGQVEKLSGNAPVVPSIDDPSHTYNTQENTAQLPNAANESSEGNNGDHGEDLSGNPKANAAPSPGDSNVARQSAFRSTASSNSPATNPQRGEGSFLEKL